jgi:predicted extracellular nuclease
MISATAVRLRVFLLAVVAALALGASPAWAAGPLRISQVYGGGGNSGATYTHDFIELFNSGTTLVDLTFMSLQYGSTTGNIGPNAAQITELSGFVAPGQYVLVQEAQGAGGTTPLSPDITDPTPITMSATGGKVALVGNAAGLNCGAAATPCGPSHFAQIVDLVGYDGANMFEGAGAAPTLSNTTAALRGNNGCTDTDNNAADFTAAAPNPRNRLSPTFDCQADVAPQVTATTPTDGATSVAVNANVSVTFSEAVNVTGSWFTISCGSSGSHTATASGGPQTFTLNPDADFANSETCTVTIVATQVSDQDTDDPPDNMTANHVFSFTTESPPPPDVHIHDVQGASHTAAMLGPVAGVVGIVTAKRSNGYYMQDPSPDANDATSEGIFVFTSSAPSSINVGDSVRVSGTVVEFRPGGSGSTNLTITEITGPTTTVLSTGNPLPATTVVGMGGRVPPGQVIEDDAAGSVETTGIFDPATDGIDFYESMEHMRLQVNNAVSVGPENNFGEIFVLADDGAGAAVRTARGGIVIRDLGAEPPGDYRSGDFNPERIQLDDAIVAGSTPAAHVGDHFNAPAVGILDYDFGNFEVNLTAALTTVSGGLTREFTDPQGPTQVSIATYNVENLDANEPQAKFDTLAGQIVNNLRSPDVVALEEIQDNNGATNDSVVDANLTLDKLVAAIQSAGGPAYSWRQINPVDDQDGGEPGGNIRVAFLFRTDRGVEFIDRPGGDSVTPTTVVAHPSGPQLSFSPGRVSPTHSAWNSSRKPLAAEFKIRNRTFFMIANHFSSKGGDQPLFGRFQPPARSSEVARHQQAQLVNDFVDSILAVDPNAHVVVIGDINDFQFSQTVDILEGGVLNDLVETLPEAERYSYVFEGNSQVLDHILVTNATFGLPFVFDAVHANAEFADQASDHDPNIVRLMLNSPPRAGAGGPYTASEGGSAAVSAIGTDDEGDALTYAWDLDNNGSFETAGQSATFSAAALDGPATRTVRVQVSDGAATDVAEATVNIANVAPTATLVAPASTFAGFPFALSLTGASDPSVADTAAGFTYAFDCGDGSGYGAFAASASASCATTTTGSRNVRAKARDKDGDVSEYTATVQVIVTFDSLCDLVQALSSDENVAEELCDKLAKAEAATTAGSRAGHLGAFRNQVDAKTGDQPGKAFTAEEGALLKQVSTEL